MAESKTYYYARVSSTSQNLDRQIEAFRKDGANERDIITEKQSGKDFSRPEYQAMKYHMLRDGDTLVVMSIDRLGRNKEGIKEELAYYKEHHVRVRILDLPTTNIKVPEGQEWIIDMVDNILIEVMASMAEQERITIRKRQAEGIAEAKKRGVYRGGHIKKIDENKLNDLYSQYMSREITKCEMAKQLGVTRKTMDRILERRGFVSKTRCK